MKHVADPSNSTEAITNNSIRCYVSCISTKLGLYDKATGWSADAIEARFVHVGDRAELRSGVDTCIERYGQLPDECEAAVRVHECLTRLKRSFETGASGELPENGATARTPLGMHG